MADDSDVGQENGRAKRTKQDRQGRFAALQKLKDLKGTKNKVTLTDVDNVYEEVDEKEYSKRVQRRQEDDWIVDDDGSGYVEDGREVFDDDLDDGNVAKAKGAVKGQGKKDSSKGIPGKRNNIKNMLFGMTTKNKEKDTNKIKDDDILGDIMQELKSTPSNTPLRQSVSTLKKKVVPSGSTISRTPTSIPRTGLTSVASRLLKAEPKRLPFGGGACNVDDETYGSTSIEEFDSQRDEGPLDGVMDIDQFDSQQELKRQESQSSQASTTQIDTTCEDKFESHQVFKQTPPTISEFDMTSGWETIKNNVDINQSVAVVDLSNSELPLTQGEDGEQVLRMYWFDAYEDPYVQPGTVYLFGKVYIESAKSYVSCCVSVKNIEKHIYVLPRDTVVDLRTGQDTGTPVSFMDVYEEFNSKVAERYKILQFKSRRVLKKYGFDPPTIPRESEYLEVKYPAEHSLPTNLKGTTFSHVFGANASALENFLLEKRVKGPCWLNIKNPQKASPPISWCKVEAQVTNMDQIELVTGGEAPPPLTVMSLNLRTVVNSRSQQVEIVAVACLVQNEFHVDRAAPQPPFQQHFCLLSRPTEEPWPLDHRDLNGIKITKVDRAESERHLLNLFLAKINKIDPDVIVGHDVASYDLDILLHRFTQNKVDHWSRLGRLRRSNVPQSKGVSRSHLTMSGRLVCDVKISAKELIRARSYDLETLCQQVLHLSGIRPDLSSDAVKKMYSSSNNLQGMIAITMQDAANTLKLMYELNVLPLALQITSIAGNLLSRTLLGGRSERNEYLLLHAFHDKGYIVPDRQGFKKSTKGEDSDNEDGANEKGKSKKGRRKPAYAGGLVLDPKRGFYDKYVLLMDFNSLYPSIIQEFNICFTTVDRQVASKKDAGEEEVLPDLPDPLLPTGILPTEIRKLVDSRREVKKLINDKLSKDLLLQYDIRQKALKLTANSMYGCLGFSNSRFYAKPLAALITSKGREILLQTRDLVRKMNLDVIYGDTDSLMIDSNSIDFEQVMKVGLKIKQEVNKMYKHLELDVDGVFQRLLLLKKKKYAAVTVTQVVRDNKKEMITQQEIKGLDIVRRDWSQLATRAGKYALEQILGDFSADERIARIQQHLEGIRDGFQNGTIDLSLLEIAKQLTKNPENYPDAKNLSHVQVALRTNSRGGKKLVQGDTVSFIVCQDGSSLAATQRAYSLEEMKLPTNAHLKPDIQYYLAQQVHPVVSRLCDLLEGIDAVRIAEFLGIDPSGYRAANPSSNNEYDSGNPPVTDEERFQSCDKFYYHCPDKACGFEMSMDNVFRKTDDGTIEFALSRCGNPNCKKAPYSSEKILVNRMSLTIRKHIQLYYAGWLVCEDQSCAARTRRLPLKSTRAQPVCIGCGSSNMNLEYNDLDLYTQLCFYQHMFDVSKAMSHLQPSERDKVKMSYNNSMDKAYKAILNHVNQTLLESGYSQVNLAGLFYSFRLPKGEAKSTF